MIKRPMLIITIGYIIGIILGLYLKINITLFAAFFVVVALCVIVIIFLPKNSILKRFKGIEISRIAIIFISIVISFSFVKYKEYKYNIIYRELNSEVRYVGTIVDEKKETKYYNNYILEINNINDNNKYKNIKLILKVKKQNGKRNNHFEYGDTIVGVGTISIPEQRRNYKGFDYSQYLKTKGISVICESNQNKTKILKKNSIFVINMWIIKLRNQIKNNLEELTTNNNYELAVALLLGDSTLLSDNQKEIFSKANLSHILAISGMHISYIIMGCSVLLKKLGKKKSRYFSIIILTFFSIFTGNSPSVLRAVIMGMITLSAKLFYRKSDVINNISISCFIILLINPYNILNLGFQLSFIGTLGIILFYKKISNYIDSIIKIKNKILIKIKDIIIVSVSANILLFPIILYNYNTVSLVFLVSNILVTPLLGVMLLCGYLTAFSSLLSIQLSKWFAIPLNFLFNLFNLISQISSNFSFLRFRCVTPDLILVLGYYCVIAYIMYFYKKKHLKILKIALILTIILSIIFNLYHFINPKLQIYFVDVGQGDCSLIITNSNKTILIDGGGNDGYDVGKNVLVPYLMDRKIMRIDYMIISHFDSDHVGRASNSYAAIKCELCTD